MTSEHHKTGAYVLIVDCIETILGYCESAFIMGFSDVNVWRAVLEDGVPDGGLDPTDPDGVFKLDSVDLVTAIHYLLDHRRRLVGALETLRGSLEDPIAIEIIDAAIANQPGPLDD